MPKPGLNLGWIRAKRLELDKNWNEITRKRGWKWPEESRRFNNSKNCCNWSTVRKKMPKNTLFFILNVVLAKFDTNDKKLITGILKNTLQNMSLYISFKSNFSFCCSKIHSKRKSFLSLVLSSRSCMVGSLAAKLD